ncbi:MAG TPA: hypothetical protein VLT33_22545 [Labilithrix sp.]|nr:hypothetical protein [Labilithrix sp.]
MPALQLFPPVDRPSDVRHQSGFAPAFDRAALAAAMLDQAEALLARDELEEAGARFQTAAHAFDAVGDAAGSARALLGLGRVLLGLEDPACRAVLEDAGTCFEDLGDEAGVRHVERLLRAAESSVEARSPRSFHSAGLMKAAAPHRSPG